MRQIKRQGRLPANKRTMLGAILFIPAIIIFSLIFKQISDWRTDIQFQNERNQLNSFVSSVYKPLVESQDAILFEKRRMQKLLTKVDNLGREHPNHAELVSQVIQKWLLGLQEYNHAYKTTDREIRRAWISYNTMDQNDVLAKFATQAARLDLKNKKAEKKYRNTIFSIQDELIQSLDNARKLLDSNRKSPRKKSQKNKNQLIRETIVPFNDNIARELINFLGTIDIRLKEQVEKLQKIIYISSQQSILIRNHLQNNPDLEAPLTTTINNWKMLENNSKNKLREILYVTEAEYITLSLDLPLKNPAVSAMHKSLRRNIPLIVGKAEERKQAIDQSYNIGSPYRKK